jgi:hypothetical protein
VVTLAGQWPVPLSWIVSRRRLDAISEMPASGESERRWFVPSPLSKASPWLEEGSKG